MVTTLDSYSETNYLDDYIAANPASVTAIGQSFITPNDGVSYNLDSAKFYINNNSGATGTCYAKLYAHTGTYGSTGLPTGGALATSDAYDCATIGASYALRTFTFSGAQRVSLSPNANYCIVADFGTFNNWMRVGIDSSTPSHAGNDVRYNAGWIYNPTVGLWDIIFYVYGEAPTAPSSIKSGANIASMVALINGGVIC